MKKLIPLIFGLITLNPASLEAQNTPPSFTAGPNVTVSEDSGPALILNWATGIDPSTPPGNPSETGQMVSLLVSNGNPSLFSVQPAVSPTGGTLSFTPAPNACGSANVTVVARDNGGTASGGQDTSAPQTGIIQVTCVNDCPVANPLSRSVNQGSTGNFQLTGSDPDGDALQFGLTTPPAHGSLVVSFASGAASYTPNAGYCGPDSFGFAVNDGACTSAPATVSIDVVCTSNNCPIASATVSPTFVTTNQTNVVIAANSSNACVEFNGSSSSDPDGDALTFLWFEPPNVVPFASGAVVSGCFDLGTHHIVLAVDDGSCTTTRPLEVVVISPCGAVRTLIALVEGSSLSLSRKRPLIATLAAACASFEHGRSIAGIKQLQAFQNKVQSQVAPSAPALAQQLIATAQAIIDALSGP